MHSKCQAAAASTIWVIKSSSVSNKWVIQAFHMAFLHKFSIAIFREKQTLMVHLLTATKNTSQLIFGLAMCMTFDWVLLVTPMVQCTDLLCVSGENDTRLARGNPLGTQEKCGTSMAGLQLISHVTSENTSLATYNIHLIGQDWPVVWPARSPDLTSFYFFLWDNMKTMTYSSQLITKRILLPILLRQQQPPSRNLAFFSTKDNLCFVVIGFLFRSVAVH